MDTKIISRYGEDILSYRMRTARQKNRMRYEDFDKQLIQLHKKENELHRQIRNLGWTPLNPPIQKGWIRCFELRADVAACKHAEFFEAILKKINTYQYDWRKGFKKKKRKFGRKIYVDKPQNLLTPDERHFRKLEFNDAEQQFFYETYQINNRKEIVKKYVFKDDWRFVLKIRANMIDKVRIKDSELESKIKSIENYLEKNDHRKRQGKILNGCYQYRRWEKFEKHNEVDLFKGKSVREIMDEIKQY